MKNLTKIAIAVALISGVTAYGAAEVVVNGGFETGQLAPWVTDKFIVAEWASRTGIYGASASSGGVCPLYAYLQQDLGTTIYPAEVIKAESWGDGWASPEPGDNKFSYIFGNDYPNADVTLAMRLGGNEEFDVSREELNGSWFRCEYPLTYIKNPFDSIFVRIVVSERDRYHLWGAVDDVSILITMTGVEPTSLGRVKAVYR